MFENCKVIHLIRSMHNWNQYCLWFSVNANIKCQTALNVITLEKKKIRDSLVFVKREKGSFGIRIPKKNWWKVWKLNSSERIGFRSDLPSVSNISYLLLGTLYGFGSECPVSYTFFSITLLWYLWRKLCILFQVLAWAIYKYYLKKQFFSDTTVSCFVLWLFI